jgi:hypothetical protein
MTAALSIRPSPYSTCTPERVRVLRGMDRAKDEPPDGYYRQLWYEALWGAGLLGSVLLVALIIAAAVH